MTPPDGTGRWLGWLSPLWPVWLWHALFDGTWACRCPHSAAYRDAIAGEQALAQRKAAS